MTDDSITRRKLRHLDDEFAEFDDRLTLDEMSHADLVEHVRQLEARVLDIERDREPRWDRGARWDEGATWDEGPAKVVTRSDGSQFVNTFGGEVDVEPARSSISLAELHRLDRDPES